MIPHLERRSASGAVDARRGGGSSTRGLALKPGNAPMRLRIHNEGGSGPAKMTS